MLLAARTPIRIPCLLSNKPLTELRGIAQALDIPGIFQKTQAQLIQEIELKQKAASPIAKIEIPHPSYDARLMTKPPSKRSSRDEMEELLAPYVERGLHLKFDENSERWYMTFGKRSDEGTMRMPLKTVIRCAERVME